MDLKLTVRRPGGVDASDVVVTCDATATSGAIAQTIAERDPRRAFKGDVSHFSIRVDGPGPSRVLRPDLALSESGVRSGDYVSLVPFGGRFSSDAGGQGVVATLSIYEGPDAGKKFNLAPGTLLIGRDRSADVSLNDPLVSKRHARLNVGETLEIFDLGSVNGVEVDGLVTPRTVLRPGDKVTVGDTVLLVEHHRPTSERGNQGDVAFNRSPYLNPVFDGIEVEAPEVPERPQRQPFPMLAMLMPLLIIIVILAVPSMRSQPMMFLFLGLSPLMMVGYWFSMNHGQKKELAEATRTFHRQLDHLAARLDLDRAEEVGVRRHEHRSVNEIVDSSAARGNLLWAMRPDRHGFLELRVGMGSLPTRSKVDMPEPKKSIPELYQELVAVVTARADVSPVPVVAPLAHSGAIGIAGTRDDALGAARALIAQVTGLHSPAEVVLAAVLPAETAGEWDWLKWLPHTSSQQNPLECDLLAAGAAGCNQLVAALDELIRTRMDGTASAGDDHDVAEGGASVVVLIEDAAPVDRPRLVALAEAGRRAGVYVIWVAEATRLLPAACEVFYTHDPTHRTVATGYIEVDSTLVPVAGEALSRDAAVAFARDMSPVQDAGAAVDESSDVPMRVSFLSDAGLELASSSDPIIDRWRQSDSLPLPEDKVRKRRRKKHGLAAYIGASAHGPLTLDLRTQGPHALVGGTTGSGKSEFLQSWVMGLATMHSPNRVTFLFVDYKGGAAFSECVKLPHTVGLVTDLTMHLVHRALRSLDAELRYREHILNAKKAKDVLELEARGDPECPPSLLIVVDEFAALVGEVPEFVDGVVNVAQRGRSLGLHLILATQRPAGVIKDNLRANTNLRVALRMADETDSDDVIGSKLAATFDPSIPGRGVAKTGPGRLHLFQSAYVGGWTTSEPPPPPIAIVDLAVGTRAEWEIPEEIVAAEAAKPTDAEQGPNDLARLVQRTCEAADKVGIEAPRKPWLPELATVYDLAKLPQSRNDVELIFGVADDPDNQRQVPIAYHPDTDGNMSVIGTGGSGKSTFLRTLAVSAGLSTRGGPCQVYGLDFGSRGLAMLESLPHVGSIVTADDDERVMRLLRMLRETIDERAERYSAVRASSITEYRRLADRPDEPRIILLLDGMAAFRQAHEISTITGAMDSIISIASEGRPVGVHLVVSADRPTAIPSSLASSIQRRLILRLANADGYAFAYVPKGMLDERSPAGRGCVGDDEVQVSVLGGTADTSEQSRAMTKLGDEIGRSMQRAPVPEVGRLPEAVTTTELPPPTPGRIHIGRADVDLGPFALSFDSPVFIVGPPRSGKTTALVTIASQLRRAVPGAHFVYLGDGRSALRTAVRWDEVADDDDAIEAMAKSLIERLEAGAWPPGGLALFFDGAHRMATLMCDQHLVKAVTLAGRAGQVVIADADIDQAATSYALLKALRVARYGLALVPDQYDGDSVFKTPFPRTKRTDFPPGRALYVRDGRIMKVQIAETAAEGVVS
ncbi:MAG TPA: FtsK/SpoIIIE domain-containing protein [Acidimicrobiales bacterium]|nr:FtsK/SpoIIIE domain-containing protein [Acidimicrobiales bacterium]